MLNFCFGIFDHNLAYVIWALKGDMYSMRADPIIYAFTFIAVLLAKSVHFSIF